MARKTKSKKYVNWRKKVYWRDKYTCQKCGVKDALNAHHIEGWAFCPKKRYWVSNGVTLCARCHYLYHEVFLGGSKNRSTKSKYDRFKKSFNVLEDHPIDYAVFSSYIRS